jgi:hypothetical protein
MSKEIIPHDKWQLMNPQERLENLLHMTTDQCHDVLSEPIDFRNGILMGAKINVIRAVLHTCMKLGMRDRDISLQRDKMLAELTHKMKNGNPSRTSGRDPLDEPVE